MSDTWKSREIIVTGAHRSGTSAISNFLANLGIDVGDPQMLLQQAQDNPRGFFERLDVLSLNDAILRCSNSTWDHPDMQTLSQPHELPVTDDIPRKIQEILDSFQTGEKPFLLKDPRFSLTMPAWLKYFSHPLVIICIRNPLEIARSLQKRNGFSIYKCLAIWESYLCQLIVNCRNLNCLYVNFNRILEDPQKYGTRLSEGLAANKVRIELPLSAAISASFDTRLKHEEYSSRDLESLLSVRQMELWKNLELESDISRLANKQWNFKNYEALRQKDTDIGYSRMEIKLITDFIDDSQNSIETILLVGKNERFTFDLNQTNVQSFRLMPLNTPCVIKFLSFEIVSSAGKKQKPAPSHSNGSFEPQTSYFYFPHRNPSIRYKSPFEDVAKVIVEILFVTLDTETTKQLLIDYFVSINENCPTKHPEEITNRSESKLSKLDTVSQKEKSGSDRFFRRLRPGFHLVKLALRPRDFVTFLRYYKVIVREPSLFSSDFYLQQNEDVDPSSISPLDHFFAFGWKEGRDPSPDFSVSYYLETHKDVNQQDLNPLLHYLSKGWKEGRNPSSSFDTNTYIAAHPEILSTQVNPLVHQRTRQHIESTPKKDSSCFEFEKRNVEFVKAVTVIIPVYLSNDEAVRTLKLLIDSLTASYPTPSKNLHFLVIDDASPMRSCRSILQDAGFIKRSDVNYCENEQNSGFTRTVNKGIKQASGKSDIVILNSDTEIYGPVFEILQRACSRTPHIASVTPLSNRATIASLINWPYGIDTIYSLAPKEISATVERTGLIGPSPGSPTGHGFCMYMSRATINDIGLFNDKTFEQGYGEENDWSMRAIMAGYTHHICTECFVFHHESKSFAPKQKAELQKKNTRKLTEIYPYYSAMVQKYINDDPLKHHRKLLKIFLLEGKKKANNLQTICFIIHDSFTNHEGGVQQHVKQLINSLNELNRFELMVVSPNSFKGELYELHLFQKNESIHLSCLKQNSLQEILLHLEDRIDYLHVHHTHGLLKSIKDWIKKIKVHKKILTIHDYDLFCSNPFLLNDDGVFCLSQSDRNSCRTRSCESENNKENSILPIFDIIFVPSDNCQRYVSKIALDPLILSKIKVLPHFLPFSDEIDTSSHTSDKESINSKNIIFLGSLFPHKGGDIFLNSLELLGEAGFTTYVWGQAQESLLAKYTNIPKVVPYRNWRELLELYQNYGAHIVVIPAVCAETFSYTLFEALFLFEIPVVVGPYGNPAEIVAQHSVGEILSSLTATKLTETVTKISNNYPVYREAVKKYKRHFYSDFTKERYLETYNSQLFGTAPPPINVSFSENYPAPIVLSDSGKALMNKALQRKGNTLFRVLFIHALSEQDPPFFFRVENPKHYLEKSGNRVDTYHLNDIPLQADKYDLIYLSRTPLTDKLAILLNNARACAVPSVLDVDDLIFHSDFLKHFYFLNSDSPECIRYQELLHSIEKTFNNVDVLLGSTPEIAAMGGIYGKTSIYIRNMLRFSHLGLYKELFETRPHHKEFQIGYFAGSSTHNKDFELLIPALIKIFNNYPETKLLLMGFIQKNSFLQNFSENITVKPFEDYDGYLKALQRCKVAVVPIAQINSFSNAKSNIKFLEAAAVGTPIITSPINEMRYSIENGVTGWIAENKDQWVKYLEAAITGDSAEYVGECARVYVMEKFSEGSALFNKLLATIADQT